ncbi:MAG: prolipoprotein diacylglyceryl transferase, partial [Planctomycetota bacterium]
VFDLGMWLLLSGIVGARLLYVLLNYGEYADTPSTMFAIWQGGLVWYGGMILALPVGLFLMRRYKMPIAKTTDLAACGMLLALGIGRWACLCMGDDYGSPTDLPWGIRFWSPDSLIVQGAPDLRGVKVHPTQLYMSVNALWLFFIVEVIRRKARYAGTALAWMLILYAVTRGLVIEPFRGDFVERNPSYKNHAAAGIKLSTDGVAFRAERNAVVQDANGVSGKLLADVAIDAETPEATVPAMTDEAWKGTFTGHAGWKPTIEQLPAGVTAVPTFSRRYNSHLPAPPDYVSTSQTIGIFILLFGVGVLLVSRRMKLPGVGPDAPDQTEA